MALEKTTVEVPFMNGLNQKARPEVTEIDIPYMLRNVDLRKGTGLVKRLGRTALPTTVLGPGSSLPTIANPKRLATRDTELVVICETAGSWGSGGGIGAAGDTMFSYSANLQAWKPFGKVPRPTSEVLYSAPPTDETLQYVDSAAAFDRLLTVQTRDTGTHVTAIDLSSGTRLLNNDRLSFDLNSPTCIVMGTRIYIFGDTTANDLIVYYYDTANHSAGIVGPTTVSVGTLTASSRGFDVTTDGSSLYVSLHVISGGSANIRLLRLDSSGAVQATQNVTSFTSGNGGYNAISYGAGGLACAYVSYNGANQTVQLVRVTNNTTLALGTVVAVSGTLSQAPAGGVRLVTQSTTANIVFWDKIYDTASEVGGLDGSGAAPGVYWRTMGGTSSVPAQTGIEHFAINLQLWAEPFSLSSRIYLPVLGVRFVQPGSGPGGAGYYLGAYLTEVDGNASSSTVATLMPVAANFLDVVGQRYGRKVSVYDNKAYITATARQHNPFDPEGQLYYVEYPIVGTLVYDFADFYRWQTALHKQDLHFSGALPYVFDGQNLYESGFVWRPEIRGAQLAAGGSLSTANSYSYRVTYERRDAKGNRLNSSPSYAVEGGPFTPSGGNLSVQVSVGILPLSMFGDASNYFPGKLYVVLWRANTAQVVNGEYVRVQEERFHPYDTSNLLLTDGETDDAVDAAERLYIIGGELENYSPPPCRVLFQHRDRLFAYNTETKTIWYTKPMLPERPAEWSLSQQIPIPEDVVAGASLENAAIFFTTSKTYALEGAGPAATGIPPDGFSRLTLINADIGCAEDCAAWRAPPGVIFRGANGLWLVTRGFEFQYIGAPVEDEVNEVGRFCAGLIDPDKAAFRLYYERNSAIQDPGEEGVSRMCSLVYWYDTGRWSRDDWSGAQAVSATYWNVGGISGPISTDGSAIYEHVNGGYLDSGVNYYPMSVTMGWARFGDLHAFKRVWRVLLSLKMFTDSALKIMTWRDFTTEEGEQEREFSSADVGVFVGAQLRMHLKYQKLSAIKVFITDVSPGDGIESRGVELYGLGYELGIKRGAVKLAATRSL